MNVNIRPMQIDSQGNVTDTILAQRRKERRIAKLEKRRVRKLKKSNQISEESVAPPTVVESTEKEVDQNEWVSVSTPCPLQSKRERYQALNELKALDLLSEHLDTILDLSTRSEMSPLNGNERSLMSAELSSVCNTIHKVQSLVPTQRLSFEEMAAQLMVPTTKITFVDRWFERRDQRIDSYMEETSHLVSHVSSLSFKS